MSHGSCGQDFRSELLDGSGLWPLLRLHLRYWLTLEYLLPRSLILKVLVDNKSPIFFFSIRDSPWLPEQPQHIVADFPQVVKSKTERFTLQCLYGLASGQTRHHSNLLVTQVSLTQYKKNFKWAWIPGSYNNSGLSWRLVFSNIHNLWSGERTHPGRRNNI